jgi:hypothetical protein
MELARLWAKPMAATETAADEEDSLLAESSGK